MIKTNHQPDFSGKPLIQLTRFRSNFSFVITSIYPRSLVLVLGLLLLTTYQSLAVATPDITTGKKKSTEEIPLKEKSKTLHEQKPTEVAAIDVTTCAGGTGYPNGGIETDAETLMSSTGPFSYQYYFGNSVDPDRLIEDGSDIFLQKAISGTAEQDVSGATTARLSGINEGIYTVVITDLSTDEKSLPITVVVEESISAAPVAISSADTKDNTVCDLSTAGSYNGQITLEVTDGSSLSDYTFEWYVGSSTDPANLIVATSKSLSQVQSGVYTVLITDNATNCETILQHTINDATVNPSLSSVATGVSTVDVTDCVGSNDFPNGSITIDEDEVENGSGTYSYEYYFGNSVLAANLIVDNEDIFVQKGTGSAIGSSVVSGASTSSITGLNPGVYTAVIVDEETGCKSVPFTVEVEESTQALPIAISSTGTVDNTVCDVTISGSATEYNGAITVVTTDGSSIADYVYQWYEGLSTRSISLITETSNVLENVRGGTYTVVVTDLFSNCTMQLQHTIQNTTATPTFTDPSVDVLPVSETACANSSGYPNGGITVDLTALVDFSSASDYLVDYYFGTSALPANLLTVDGTTSIFDQKGISSPGFSTKVEETAIGTLQGLNAGVYTVVVTDSRTGCTSLPQTVTVTENGSVASFTASTQNNTVCNFGSTADYNGAISISPATGSASDFTYRWFAGQSNSSADEIPSSALTSATVSENVLSQVPGGFYTVEITDKSTNCQSLLSYLIEDDLTALPVVDDGEVVISSLTNCEGSATFPNGVLDASAAVSGGSGSYEFNWYHGENIIADNLLEAGSSILTQKGEGTSSPAVVTFSAEGDVINGLNEGVYTLQVIDAATACASASYQFTITEDLASIAAVVNKSSDDFACSIDEATGSLSAVVSTSGTFSYEWYTGTSAAGTIISSTATISGLSQGSYTVKIIDNSSGCYITLTSDIDRKAPSLSIMGTAGSQTNCSPNGGASVSVDGGLFSGNTPVGFTASYVYEWYLGSDTSTPLVEGSDPGNGSNPTGVNTAAISGLTAGEYTVVVTETSSGCSSDPLLLSITDGVSANAPQVMISADVIPSDCGAASGELSAAVTSNPTSNSLSFEWYEGAGDFTSGAGTPLATGDFLAADPSVSIDIVNVSAGGGTSATTSISGILAGVYTLVAIDQVTGCRYQQAYDLPFIAIAEVNALTIKNIEACPDNGQMLVSMRDDPTNAGFVAGDVDDITQYTLFLYAKDNFPADRLTAYTYEGLRFPMTIDPLTGEQRDGDGALMSTSSASSAGDNVIFVDLPAGDYIALAREIANPAFNPGSTLQCWSLLDTEEIEQNAYDPVLTSTSVTDNTVCDEVTYGGNGSISVTVEKDPADVVQSNGFRFTLYDGESNTATVLQTSDFSTAEATFTVSSLPPGSYLTEIERLNGTDPIGCTISQVAVVQDLSEVPVINNAVVSNQMGCTNNTSSVTINDADITGLAADYTYTWYLNTLDLTDVIAGETGASLSLTDAGAVTIFVQATNTTTGCETPVFQAEIEDLSESPALELIVTANDSSCDPDTNEGSGAISLGVRNVTETTNYDYQWYVGENTSGQALTNNGTITGASGTFECTTASCASTSLSGIQGGQYYTVAITQQDGTQAGCESSSTIFVAALSNPLGLSDSDYRLNDNSNCSNPNGAITITSVSESGVSQTVDNYTFQWFDASGNNITNTAISTGPGTSNAISDVEGGTYKVVITSNDSECTNTGELELVVEDVSASPEIQLVSKTDDIFCDNTLGGDGTISINVLEAGASASLSDYELTWYRGNNTNVFNEIFPNDASSRNTAVAENFNFTELSGLSDGSYTVEVRKANGSPNFNCIATATFTIDPTPVVLTLSPGVEVLRFDNTNCVIPNGFLEITTVREDGFAISASSSYQFTWTDASGNAIPTANLRESGGADVGIQGVAGGTYFVTITNRTTGCSSDAIQLTVEDQIGNITVGLSSLVANSFCDVTGNTGDGRLSIDIFENGSTTASDPNDFSITWYRGSSLVTTLASALGTATISGPNNTSLAGLSNDQYTVQVIKDGTSPNARCEVNATFTIDQVLPLLTIEPDDLIVQDNDNCGGNANGFIQVSSVKENGVKVVPGINYSFTWRDGDGNLIATTDDTISELAAGTYSVTATNLITGCVSETQEINVLDQSATPIVALEAINPSTYCDPGPSGLLGDGSLSISLCEDEAAANLANYQLSWYRGEDTSGTLLSSGDGTITISADQTTINGLSDGAYTLEVVKDDGSSPNAGCSTTVTYSIDTTPTELDLVESINVTKQEDLTDGVTPNGFIEITSVNRDQVADAVTATNYTFTWYDEAGSDITSSAVSGLLAAGTGNRLEGLSNGFYEVVVTDTETGCFSARKSISVNEQYTWQGTINNDWQTAGNWAENAVPPATADVLIPDVTALNNHPVINELVEVENVVIEPSGEIEISAGALTINGDLFNDGRLEVDAGVAVILLGDRTGDGVSEVFTRLKGNGALEIIGLPVPANYNDRGLVGDPDYFFFGYDNATQSFITDPADPAAGLGLFVANTSTVPAITGFEFSSGEGPLNSGVISAPITVGADGFNLIANPYAAAIEAEQFFANTNNQAKTTGTAYLWNDGGVNVTGLRGGDYLTVNSLGAVGGLVDPGNGVPGLKGSSDFDGTFSAFQGFFVEATSAGNITFDPAMQVTDGSSSNILFRSEATGETGIVKLALKGKGLYNELMIAFDDRATANIDYSMDARKLAGSDQISFYSLIESEPMAIQAVPFPESETVITLGTTVFKGGDYEIEVLEMDNIALPYQLYLQDLANEEILAISPETTFSFTMTEGKTEDRFQLIISRGSVTQVATEIPEKSLQVYGNQHALTLLFATAAAEVTISDLSGKTVFNRQVLFEDGQANIAPDLKTGTVYLIRVADEVVKFTVK